MDELHTTALETATTEDLVKELFSRGMPMGMFLITHKDGRDGEFNIAWKAAGLSKVRMLQAVDKLRNSIASS